MDFSSITRISGMASGLDTDSLVKKMMTAESAQYNKMKQQQQKLSWQSDSYRQWNSDLFSFQSTLFNMTLSGPYGTFAVSSSSDSVMSGTSTGDAVPGTHSFQVNQLAEAATVSGTPTVGSSDKLVASGSSAFTITLADGRSQTLNIGDGKDANTINDLVSKINTLTDSSSKSMGLQAIYDSTLNKFMIRTKDTGAATSVSVTTSDSTLMGNLGISMQTNNAIQVSTSWTDPNQALGTTSMTIDGTPISINATDKISDLVKKINQTTVGTGTTATTLQASYNSSTHQFTISKSNGQSVNVQVSGAPAPGLTFSSPSSYFAVGKDAKVEVDGSDVSIPSNTSKIYGVNYTFKTVGSSTVSTTRDLDAEVKNIKDFISQYNDMNDKIYKAMNEPVYSDYQPLTDDQRTTMTDTQVTQWETKAKSGLLHNDSILSTLYNSARNATTAVVNTGSQYNSLASIGITSTSYADHGKLTVDDTKLRAALQADPDGVKALFTQQNDTDKTKKGIINQLRDSFQQAFKDTSTKAGRPGDSQNDQSTIGKALQDVATRILNEQNRLTNVENSYYKKFTAMETAMSKYNSQSSWMSQQLGASSQG
jgi:flagellar hook-associated protein 2